MTRKIYLIILVVIGFLLLLFNIYKFIFNKDTVNNKYKQLFKVGKTITVDAYNVTLTETEKRRGGFSRYWIWRCEYKFIYNGIEYKGWGQLNFKKKNGKPTKVKILFDPGYPSNNHTLYDVNQKWAKNRVNFIIIGILLVISLFVFIIWNLKRLFYKKRKSRF